MLDRGADVAAGSRFMPGGKLDYRGFRRLLSSGANLLARRMLRLRLAEYTTSLRAARLDRVPVGLVETVDHEGYSFFLACIVRMVRSGLDVVEIPIHFHERRHGQSKLPPSEIVKGALTLACLALRERRGENFPALAYGDIVCRQCQSPYCVPSPRGPRCLVCNAA
jgi:dolichol-phosphate mannosyltransferase